MIQGGPSRRGLVHGALLCLVFVKGWGPGLIMSSSPLGKKPCKHRRAVHAKKTKRPLSNQCLCRRNGQGYYGLTKTVLIEPFSHRCLSKWPEFLLANAVLLLELENSCKIWQRACTNRIKKPIPRIQQIPPSEHCPGSAKSGL